MKLSRAARHVITGITVLHSMLNGEEQKTQTEHRPPLYINVNYIPNENTFILGDSAIKAIFMRYYQSAKEAVEQCSSYVKKHHITLTALLFESVSYVGDHKLQSALTALALVYTAIQARVYYITRMLLDTHNWSLYKQEIPLEELFALPPHQFCSELLAEIQRRYATPHNALDVVQSITRFIEDTEKETALLKEYQSLATWLTQLRLKDFSFINGGILDACTDRIQRIAFMKGTFLGWVTEYRLGMRPTGSLF
jgi:hypothetical protein